MNVVLDTNVLLDYAMDRRDTFADEAEKILKLAEMGQLRCSVTVGSWYTATYVLEKQLKNAQQLRGDWLNYLSLLDLLDAPKAAIHQALLSPAKDLEDAYQYFTALHHRADYFISANLVDFKSILDPDLPVVSPSDFLKIWLLTR